MKQKKAPPHGLVDYLYAHSASKALLFFGDIYNEKPDVRFTHPPDLMWADHIIQTVEWRIKNGFVKEGDLEQARKELETLSKHDAWYARRYAVEVIRMEHAIGAE